LKKIHQSN